MFDLRELTLYRAASMLYFDHNATTPLLPEARFAWLEAIERFIGNPSSPHRLGARADAALHDARQRLATFLGCDALDIIWTSGATESNNTVLHHLGRSLAPAAEVWISAIEHPCVLNAANLHLGRRSRQIPVNHQGTVDPQWLSAQLRQKRPGCVVVMAANNETGLLQPWREIQALCQEHQVPFFCDAAQWLGKLPAAGLGRCDFVSGCAHKFGGPKGTGFLKCPSQGRMHPLLVGGKQEEGRRAGTENVPGVLAMVAALSACEQALARGTPDSGNGSPAVLNERLTWRAEFEKRLLKTLPGSEIVGRGSARLWNTVCALMPESDCRHRWVVKLDKLGFAVSTGSACASGKEEPSHVLAAMSYSPAQASRVLRFSSWWSTPPKDWEALLGGLKDVWRSVR